MLVVNQTVDLAFGVAYRLRDRVEVLRSSGWALALDLAMYLAALDLLVIGFVARRASDVWDVATSGAAFDPVVLERVAYLRTGTTTSAMSRLREDVNWPLAVDESW